MFDPSQVEPEIMSLAGLRQTDNPDFPELPSDILYDGTNLLINHPLLNIENLDLSSQNYALFNFPAYVAGTTYATGARIKDVGIVYDSLQDGNIGNTPASSPTFWVVVDLIGLYLEDIFRTVASETVNSVLNIKKANQNTKTLLQNLRLTNGVGGFSNTIVSEGSLVGIEVLLKRNQNISAVLNRIAFQFNQPQTDLPIYIYHSSQLDPVYETTITYNGNGGSEWKAINENLTYLSSLHDSGGVWYVMYDQDDVVGSAIKKVHNFDKPPCGYCDKREVNNFNLYSKYLYIRTVEVKTGVRNGTDMWDVSDNTYVPDNNFGMNFEFTVKCDLTEFIIQQKIVFNYAFRDMVVVKLLEQLANNARQNTIQEKVMILARNELKSSEANGMGLREVLDKQIKNTNFEISSLDDQCMPCDNKAGIRLKSAGLSR